MFISSFSFFSIRSDLFANLNLIRIFVHHSPLRDTAGFSRETFIATVTNIESQQYRRSRLDLSLSIPVLRTQTTWRDCSAKCEGGMVVDSIPTKSVIMVANNLQVSWKQARFHGELHVYNHNNKEIQDGHWTGASRSPICHKGQCGGKIAT